MPVHADLTGANLHVPGYKQSSDPGAVGAGKIWIDTTTGPPYTLKVRNTGDTAWETVGSSGVGDVANDLLWDAAGDLALGTGPNTATRLAIGSNNNVLKSNGTTAVWGGIGTASLVDDSVTYAKVQNVTDARVLGRAAGSAGDVQELTAGTGISIASGAISVVAGTSYQVLSPEEAQTLAANAPQFVKINGTNFPVSGLAYDGSATESAYWKMDALAYVSGDLTLRLYWYADTASSGDVKWEAAIAAITPDTDTQDVETKAFATAQSVVDTHLGTTGQRLHVAILTISNLDSLSADDLAWFKISRLGGDAADTMNATDAILVAARLAYTG